MVKNEKIVMDAKKMLVTENNMEERSKRALLWRIWISSRIKFFSVGATRAWKSLSKARILSKTLALRLEMLSKRRATPEMMATGPMEAWSMLLSFSTD